MNGPDTLASLVGCWRTQIQLPDQVLEGEASFEWLDPNGLMLMRSHTIGAALPPKAVAVIGFDDTSQRWSMVYHDDRGVSRIYAMTFDGRNWTLAGRPKDFHQRLRAVIDGDRIDATWERSEDGATWEKDLGVIYTRNSGV